MIFERDDFQLMFELMQLMISGTLILVCFGGIDLSLSLFLLSLCLIKNHLATPINEI